jgi:hypothetical protein
MTRKRRVPSEEVEMNTAKNSQPGAEPESESSVVADDLDGAIGAVTGGAAAGPEPEPADMDGPKVQPGKNPSIEDAYADMSQPAPADPIQYLGLAHSSVPPKASFRVRPREGLGVFLWMFALPWGTALPGESFVYPIIASLRLQLMRECPALIPKRYEIRLILDATGKYSLLEVPVDKLSTKGEEDTRQSFLALLKLAEGEVMYPVKTPSGLWATTRGSIDFPDVWPEQRLRTLVDLSYEGELVADINYPVLQRYRIK